MLKKYFLIYSTLILGIGLESCKRPDYSDTPTLELISCEKFYNQNSNISADSIVFKFKFKDGDGDLGLNENDAPLIETREINDANGNKIYFNQDDPTQEFNCQDWNASDYSRIQTFENYNNIFFEIDKKVNGNYVKLNNSCFKIRAYRFARLAPVNYVGPIDVNFTYTSTVDLLSFNDDLASQLIGLANNDIIRFRIRIMDRKLNMSNEVVTQDIKVESF